MTRLLVWLVLLLLVVLAILKKSKPRTPDSTRGDMPLPPGGTESMLLCAHCAVYFPASEAVYGKADLVFCSQEHRSSHESRV